MSCVRYGSSEIADLSFNFLVFIPTLIYTQVKTGSPIVCNRGDGTYELFGIKSWDLGCQEYKKTAVFSNLDLVWVQTMLQTPLTKLIANEQSYLKAKSKSNSYDTIDVPDKPSFIQVYKK